MTISEIETIARNKKLAEAIRDFRKAGKSWRKIGRALDMPHVNLTRLVEKLEIYEACLDDNVFLNKKPPGRPPLYVPTEHEVQALRRLYIKSNRAEGEGSKTAAARMFAQTGACSEELRHAILKPRKSKHTLTTVIRKAMDVPEAVFEEHRSPRSLSLTVSTAPGTMRSIREPLADGSHRTRRLRAGERQSWDDGSINFCCWVPWPMGGCKTSDKFGVKVGRFQLLVGIDDASDFCPGFSFVVRPQSSYRALDAAGAMMRAWQDDIVPESAILERGVWESHKSVNFYTAAGVNVTHVHTPHQKLVENYWNRLWTKLSMQDGQIGRYRGEMERENKLLLACQQGRQKPQDVFPGLEESMNAIEGGVIMLNAEPVESKHYGTWTPQARYRDDLAEFPRPQLDDSLSWLLHPEQHVVTVRSNGLVACTVPCPFGPSLPYHFACEGLWDYVGAKVRVYFDTYLSPIIATVVLAEDYKGQKAGTILSTKAECLDTTPHMVRMADRWAQVEDMDALERGMAYRKQYLKAVHTLYRSVGLGGKRRSSMIRADDGLGRRVEVRQGTGTAMDGGNRAQGEPATRATVPLIQHPSSSRAASGSQRQSGPDDYASRMSELAAREERALSRLSPLEKLELNIS